MNKLLQRVVEQLQLKLISLVDHSFGDLVGQILDGILEVTGLDNFLIPETDFFLELVDSGTGVDLVLLKRVGVNLHLVSLVDSLKRVGVNLNLRSLVDSEAGILGLVASEAGILELVVREAANHLWISSMNLVAQSESFLINDTKSIT